ncbi:MAG TPA: 30S ribosome-binding factor RbfA [Clostridiales bacterium]|nr:30S ribosome-binding factor RbfA [Clostridiales bacterium]
MKSNPSSKINRINDDIQIALSSLLRSIKDPRVRQGMISVVRVDTTGDLRYCRVYLSVLGLQDEKEFKKGLKSASGWLRRELGRAVSLRYTPELIFELDRSIEHGVNINKMINELGITPEEGEDEQS